MTDHDTLGIGWYRQETTCTFGTNRCLTARAVTSIDEGATWSSGPGLGDTFDICNLGNFCNPGEYFLGDYRESVANLLHAHLLFSAPVAAPVHAKLYSMFVAPRYRF